MMINDLIRLINYIDYELKKNNIVSLNYLLLSRLTFFSMDKSISAEDLVKATKTDVIGIICENSDSFKYYMDSPNSGVYLFLTGYFERVIKYYHGLMTFNREKFDNYVVLSSGGNPDEQYKYVTIEDIQNTMSLLNEAIRNYYEIYHNKRLLTTFSNQKIVEFKMKEAELSHLLGVNLRSIVSNAELRDLFHITNQERDLLLANDSNVKMHILMKIVDMKDNLLSLEEDRLRKINNYDYKYKVLDDPSGGLTLKDYAKINIRSKGFVDFKPLERISMALDFPDGYELIHSRLKKVKNGLLYPSQYSVLLSQNSLSDKYNWSTLLTNATYNRDYRYFESLLIITPKGLEKYQKDATPSISLIVELDSDDGSGSIKREFTYEEQLAFIRDVQRDFSNLDLTDIAEYFDNMANDYYKDNSESSVSHKNGR